MVETGSSETSSLLISIRALCADQYIAQTAVRHCEQHSLPAETTNGVTLETKKTTGRLKSRAGQVVDIGLAVGRALSLTGLERRSGQSASDSGSEQDNEGRESHGDRLRKNDLLGLT